MAVKGYRWYRIKRTDKGNLQLQSLNRYSDDGEEHIIGPATCSGSDVCRYDTYTTYHGTIDISGQSIVPPAKGCTCGYYAYWTIADALLRSHKNMASSGLYALVELWAWGKVQHHKLGFRAERIALQSVFVSGPLDEEIADLYLCNKRLWIEALDQLTEKQVMQVDRISAMFYRYME